MKIFVLYLLSSFLFLISVVTAEENSLFINARVIRVSDGDTIHISSNDKKHTIRFYGVDTPEKAWIGKWPAQPKWKDAKKFVENMAFNKIVTIRLKGEQTHDREVGEIFVDRKSLSREIIRSGLG